MTMAVDREAAVGYLCVHFKSPGSATSTFTAHDGVRSFAVLQFSDVLDALVEGGILRDAAAVQHEHGERIAKDHDEQADEYERLGYLGEDIYRACARRARDLSPAPEARS